ncbi:MAG: response regulator [Lachnospiraceae bacterium]|nr:response regulator [Lachnospiraceae bacterium]
MRNVMIVDDNHISVEGILKNVDWNILDCNVIACKYDGTSAAETITNHSIDLIISDIEMPGLTGLELAKIALKKNSFTKVILISAFDEFEYARQALRVGVFDYIEKPLDYDYLTEKVMNAIKELQKEELEVELLEKSKPAMVNNFFSRLIHTNHAEARYSLSDYPDYLSLHLECHFYCSVLLEIENRDEIREQLGIQRFHLELANLQTYIQEHSAHLNLSYILSDLRGPICILGHNFSNQVYFHKELYSIFTDLENYYTNSSFKLIMGIGNTVKNLWDMSLSYQSAKKALEYRFFFPQQTIFDARDNKGSILTNELFINNKDDVLIQLICKKDKVGLKDWIENFSEGLVSKCQTKNLLFIRIYDVLGNVLRFLYEMNIDCSCIEREITQVYAKIDTFHTSEELVNWLYDICALISEQSDHSSQTYHKQICDTVVNYIKQHYSENTLCLNDIADAVMISPTYLSALYKKSTSQNISDTITSVRIETACDLLLHSTISLKEISEKVGYTNQYYFSSCFKKKTGQTPSEYRK